MPKITPNTHSLCAAIGVGALCAVLTAAPMSSLFLSKKASAIEIPPYMSAVQQLDSGVCRSNGDDTILYQNIRKVLDAVEEERINNDLVKIAIAIGSLEHSPLRDDFIDYRIDGMKQYISDTSAWNDMTFVDMVKAAQNSPEYLATSADEVSNDNILIYIDHFAIETVAGHAEDLKAALLNKMPSLEDKPVWKLQAGSVENGTGGSWTLHELYYDAIDYYISNAKRLPEYKDFYASHYDDLVTLQTKGQNEGSFLNICKTSQSKDEVYTQLNEVIAAAKRINPSFAVELIDDKESVAPGDTSGDTEDSKPTAPTTPTQPTTIESNDKNVRVSGANLNANHTLNVDAISADDLKLTGDDFKNSLNQAFYDIYIRDNHGNIVSNTGKVSVSIKLPSNMNHKSDFIVYYVPTGANGEHLTDQAKAITGVKVSNDGWLTFETDHFSVYGIVEYTKGKAPNTGVVAHNENSATTAGAKIVAGIAAVLTVAGISIMARRQILRRRNNQK